MGLNREVQFDVETEERWHMVGHTLAPKEIWRKYVKQPGMKSLSIEAQRDDEHKGLINITVRPLLGKKNVVEVAINSHFDLGEEAVAIGAVKLFEECWDTTLQFALKLAQGVMSDALEAKL